LTLVRKVLAVESDSPGARHMEAMLLVDLNRFDEARPRLKALLKKNPDSLDFLLGLAWVENGGGKGDLEKARGYLDRAWELVSSDAASAAATRVCLNAAQLEVRGGHPTAAREWLDRVGDVQSAGPQLPFLLAETYRVNEDWSAGAAALSRLQPRLSEDVRVPALALETEFRMKAGDGGAMARLRPLVESDRLEDVLMALQVMQSLERWDAVEKAAAEALKRFPDERDLAFMRAAALERGGRLEESSDAFEAILKADPNDIDAANYLGYMWADAGTNLDRALELIQMAVEAEPGNAAFLDSLGWVEFRLGRLEEAEVRLRRAVELGGEDQGTVVAHHGEVLLELGQNDEAQRLLQHALDVGCEDPDHVRTLLERIRERRRGSE
jgi:predicted Zn-dependent protease